MKSQELPGDQGERSTLERASLLLWLAHSLTHILTLLVHIQLSNNRKKKPQYSMAFSPATPFIAIEYSGCQEGFHLVLKQCNSSSRKVEIGFLGFLNSEESS